MIYLDFDTSGCERKPSADQLEDKVEWRRWRWWRRRPWRWKWWACRVVQELYAARLKTARLYIAARSLKSTTTQPAVGGPKTFWEDQRAWRPKNLAAQRAEGTKVLRRQTTGGTIKYLTRGWGTKKLRSYVVSLIC